MVATRTRNAEIRTKNRNKRSLRGGGWTYRHYRETRILPVADRESSALMSPGEQQAVITLIRGIRPRGCPPRSTTLVTSFSTTIVARRCISYHGHRATRNRRHACHHASLVRHAHRSHVGLLPLGERAP